MPRAARLLHSSERVEVLSIDSQKGTAQINRQGFVQQVSLRELVIEEEDSPSITESDVSLVSSSEDLVLYLLPRLAEGTGELELRHEASYPALYGLYIKTAEGLWHPLLVQKLSPGERCFVQVSLEKFSPPWHLRLQRMPFSPTPMGLLAPVRDASVSIKMARFTVGGTQRLLLGEESVSTPSSFSSEPLFPSSPLPPNGREIDLHIEKLAPHLVGASAEVIFSYQVDFMERYLLDCHAKGYRDVIVIHGVGKKKLQSALLTFCARQQWAHEKLLVPPYVGGATRVLFEKKL
jgi:hypothetical protein